MHTMNLMYFDQDLKPEFKFSSLAWKRIPKGLKSTESKKSKHMVGKINLKIRLRKWDFTFLEGKELWMNKRINQ
jgi:hypothetical protein